MAQLDLPLFSTRTQLREYITEETTIYAEVFDEIRLLHAEQARKSGQPVFKGTNRELLQERPELEPYIRVRWFQTIRKEDNTQVLEEVYCILLKMEEIAPSEGDETSFFNCVLAFPQKVSENGIQLYLVVKDVKAALFNYPDNIDNKAWLGYYEDAEYLEKKMNEKYSRLSVVK